MSDIVLGIADGSEIKSQSLTHSLNLFPLRWEWKQIPDIGGMDHSLKKYVLNT